MIDDSTGVQTSDLIKPFTWTLDFGHYHSILLMYGYYLSKSKWYPPLEVKNLEWADAVDLVRVKNRCRWNKEKSAEAEMVLRELQSTNNQPRTRAKRRFLRNEAIRYVEKNRAYRRKIARKADEHEAMLALIASRQRTTA